MHHPIKPSELPDGATIQPDGVILFKQSRDLFKQIRDTSGKVIGLMYKGPRMENWSTLSSAQVRSRLGIYTQRADKGEVSDAVQNGLEEWTWAYGLFGGETIVRTDNLETIHQPEEGAAA